jgi:hypothetical protein
VEDGPDRAENGAEVAKRGCYDQVWRSTYLRKEWKII